MDEGKHSCHGISPLVQVVLVRQGKGGRAEAHQASYSSYMAAVEWTGQM